MDTRANWEKPFCEPMKFTGNSSLQQIASTATAHMYSISCLQTSPKHFVKFLVCTVRAFPVLYRQNLISWDFLICVQTPGPARFTCNCNTLQLLTLS